MGATAAGAIAVRAVAVGEFEIRKPSVWHGRIKKLQFFGLGDDRLAIRDQTMETKISLPRLTRCAIFDIAAVARLPAVRAC